MKRIFTLGILLISFAAFAQPANDFCISAQTIELSASGAACVAGTNIGATNDGSFNACNPSPGGQQVWYQYITTGSNNTITVTPTGSTPATGLVITYKGPATCDQNVYSFCSAATGSNAATVSDGVPPGTLVFFQVTTNGTPGEFNVCVSSTPPPPTPGNTCQTADVVCNKANFTIESFAGYTASTNFKPGCFAGPNSDPKKDMFIQFTVGVSGTLAWMGTMLAGGTEMDWAVWDITNGCANRTEVACNYNFSSRNTTTFGLVAGGGADKSEPINVVAGRTYLIQIDNWNATNTGFTFQWGGTFQMGTSALFTTTAIPSCPTVPFDLTVTNTSVGASTYLWSFPGGTPSTSTEANPGTIRYDQFGDYVASLLVTGASGCTSVITRRININAGPIVTVIPNTATICAGQSVNLTGSIALQTQRFIRNYPSNLNEPIPDRVAAGITRTINSTGMLTTTLAAGMVQSVCFTIQHQRVSDITIVRLNVNGVNYNFPLNTLTNGTNTYCFSQAILNQIEAAGGNSNTTWSLTIADNDNSNPARSGTWISWEVVLRDPNAITSWAWTPTTNMTNSTTLTPTVSPTTTTTYRLSATDRSGCPAHRDVTINVSTPPTATISGTYPICSGASAQIPVTFTGTAPWSITFNNGVTPTTVNNISANPYIITTSTPGTINLTNASSGTCVGTASGSATVVTAQSATTSNVNANCTGVTYVVTFEISGGNAAGYNVTGGAGSISAGPPYIFTSAPIASGTPYNFSVTDGSGCAPVVVSGNRNCNCPATAIISGGGTMCAGGTAQNISVALTGTPPWSITYVRNGSNPVTVPGIMTSPYVFSASVGGVYTISSMSDAVCQGSGSGSATVTVNPLPTATVSGGGAICNDGVSTETVSFALTGLGPWNLTYAINGVSQTAVTTGFSPFDLPASAAGNYTVVALSDGNCAANITGFIGDADITLKPLPIVDQLSTISACPQTTVTVPAFTSTPVGATFNWVNNNSSTGLILTGSGNIANFSASQNNTGVNNVSTVSVTGELDGCPGSAMNFDIVIRPRDNASFTYPGSQSSPLCPSGTVLPLTVSTPGGTFSNFPNTNLVFVDNLTGEIDLSSSPIGEHVVRYTTTGLCPSNSEIFVYIDRPVAPTVPTQNFCPGDAVNVVPVGQGNNFNFYAADGTTFLHNGSSFSPLISSNTTYVVTEIVNGCESYPRTFNVTFSRPAAPSVSSAGYCPGVPVTITPTGPGSTFNFYTSVGGTLLHTGLSYSPNITQTTPFTVTQIVNGCESNPRTITITIHALPSTPAPTSNAPVCDGTALTMTVGNISGTVNWTGASGTYAGNSVDVTGLPVGSHQYNVTVTSTVTGCTSLPAVLTVDVKPIPASPSVSNNGPVCDGFNLQLTAQNVADATYSWSGPNGFTSNDQNPMLSNITKSSAGSYSVAVTVDGCTSLASSTEVSGDPVRAVFTASPATGVAPLEVNFLNGSQYASAYQWQLGNGTASNEANPITTFNTPGTYNVTLTATGVNCIDTTSLTIVVESATLIVVPNVFSPNNDNTNDAFTVQVEGVKEYNFSVFNRWGTLLFVSQNPSDSWNGKLSNGAECPAGTYFYVIKAVGNDNLDYNMSGTVTLFR
jgi:gliding motility-associated-like protein